MTCVGSRSLRIEHLIKHRTRAGFALALLMLLFNLTGRAQAEAKLSDSFSVFGNADVLARHYDHVSSLQLSQYQLDVDYHHDGLYTEVQLEGKGGDVFQNDQMDKNQFRIEAAYLGYHWLNGLDVRIGRIISPMGYEGAEPWRRFTRITAFGGIFAYLQNGLALRYTSPAVKLAGQDFVFTAYGSYIDGAWSGDADPHDPSFETQVGIDWGPFVARAGFAYERYDNDTPDLVPKQDRNMLNVWAQYTIDIVSLAVEYDHMDQINGLAGGLWLGNTFLAFAKVAFTSHWQLGVRGSMAVYDSRQDIQLFSSKELTVTPRWQIWNHVDDNIDWDFAADIRFQKGLDAIQGFPSGVVLELGTTMRY
jgi:hypothetical protein